MEHLLNPPLSQCPRKPHLLQDVLPRSRLAFPGSPASTRRRNLKMLPIVPSRQLSPCYKLHYTRDSDRVECIESSYHQTCSRFRAYCPLIRRLLRESPNR